MEHLASAIFGRVLGLTIFIALSFSKGCCSEEITYNFGENVQMACNRSSSTVAWFKDYTENEISQTQKLQISSSFLYIFCLEPLDSGEYVCKDKNTAAVIASYKLTVTNPENRSYFHIYNQHHDLCVSRYGTEVFAEACNLDHCKQKWSWTSSKQIVSAQDNAHPKCMSVNQLSNGSRVILDACDSSTLLQKWECKVGDLLSIQGETLYFNYGNYGVKIVLFWGIGVWSRWVKYQTRHNLCVKEKREVIFSPDRLVLSTNKQGSVTCNGVNFIRPSYKWFKDGKYISKMSGLQIHIDIELLFVPFAYLSISGNYTCEVSDAWATLNATVTIEVFEDPSVIYHSLDREVNVGIDVCLSCQMYTTDPQRVKWYKDGSHISEKNPRLKIDTSRKGKYNKLRTRLCVTSVVLSDKGKYACEINSNHSRSIKEGILQVQKDSPTFAKPEVFIERSEGGWLMCNVSGYPLPRLIWYFDGKHIKENKMEEMSLTVKEVPGIQNYTCFASNRLGTDSRSRLDPVLDKRSSNKSPVGMIIGIIIGILVIILVVFLIFCYCRRKKKPFNNNDTVYDTVRYTATPSEYTTPSQRPARIEFQPRCSADSDPDPKGFSLKARVYHKMKPRGKADWEIPPDCIKLDKKLGEGQFGQVWKGHVLSRKGSRTVAVKMLRENSPIIDRKAIIDELDFMKTMAPHPNIVALVGCCTRTENVMIVVEYVPNGNLKDFLLRGRGGDKDTYSNLAPYSTSLTSKDLISFAYQIAKGMSYLERIKCVHRDLAARNILVGDEKTCKIADFGLARDIYSENYYRKTNGGRLPLRWMAYESIFNGITTNQSDAWSFGVLLWEIITLGGNPYPDMDREQLIEGLQRGYRMPKPHHCSDEVYAIMWECWQQNPDKRPTFAELTASFLRLISLQQNFINTETFGEKDYENAGSFEETGDN